MAERLVTHVMRNTQGDIVAIGNLEQGWYLDFCTFGLSQAVTR